MFITILECLSWCFGIITTLYAMYFCCIALVGSVRKKNHHPQSPPQTRFGLIIPARNEAAVIGQLIESLKQQRYPINLYDIIVVPNNCTDNTREVAIRYGAEIFDPIGEIHSKGEVLHQVIEAYIKSNQYNAVCVFDADNIVSQDFLQHMNDACIAGANIAQGFKDSKNPLDSGIATGFSIYYWIIGRFYNSSREALGLSSFITGTGFMVTISFLKKISGWNTRTITEDFEFSAQCVLAGERVHYVPDAIVYDEQPLTFKQSWKQRRRWSTGFFECAKIYLGDLFKHTVDNRKAASLDLTMTYMGPVIFILSIIVFVGEIGLMGFKFYLHYPTGQPQFLLACLNSGLLLCILLAAFITYISNRHTSQGIGRGIVFFILFVISWIPINLVSLLKKQRKWEAITHIRAITLNDI